MEDKIKGYLLILPAIIGTIIFLILWILASPIEVMGFIVFTIIAAMFCIGLNNIWSK